MTAAPLPVSTHPRRRRKSYTFFWCSLGIYAAALLFLLSGLSDACKLPPPFEAMELKGPPKLYYEVGEIIEYKCKKGYLYLSPYLMSATCEPNHTWASISDNGCIKVQCTMLQDPLFGKVHYIDGVFSWGARAKFTCMEGYYLAGMPVLRCELKGDEAYWNGHPPSCEKLQNGRQISRAGEFSHQAVVMFECVQGFYMEGSSMVVCSTNNSWEPSIPKCLKGPQSTHPTKPPVYSYPGYPNPREGIFGQELDSWVIALIVITSIVGVLVICLIMLRYFENRKKSTIEGPRKHHVEKTVSTN